MAEGMPARKRQKPAANLSDPDDGRPVKITLTIPRDVINKALALASLYQTTFSGVFSILVNNAADEYKEQIAEFEAIRDKMRKVPK